MSDQEYILLFALRYSFGKKPKEVLLLSNFIIKHLSTLSDDVLKLMISEVNNYMCSSKVVAKKNWKYLSHQLGQEYYIGSNITFEEDTIDNFFN